MHDHQNPFPDGIGQLHHLLTSVCNRIYSLYHTSLILSSFYFMFRYMNDAQNPVSDSSMISSPIAKHMIPSSGTSAEYSHLQHGGVSIGALRILERNVSFLGQSHIANRFTSAS